MKSIAKSKRYVSVMGLLLAFSFALFMFAGCSHNATSLEDQNNPDDKLLYLDDLSDPEINFQGPPLFEIEFEATAEVVGIAGGVVEVELSGSDAAFVVPSGALTAPVEISLEVTKVGTPLGPVFVYECGPDGTTFKNPAKLYQPVPRGQEYAHLYYFNEAKFRWELQEIVKVKDGIAVFKIYHFSKYGIS